LSSFTARSSASAVTTGAGRVVAGSTARARGARCTGRAAARAARLEACGAAQALSPASALAAIKSRAESKDRTVLATARPAPGRMLCCAAPAQGHPSAEGYNMGSIILLVVLVGIVVYFIGIYNGLVTARNGYKNAFAQIDVQLTRRYDLIPNLVETAKGYMKFERETLEAVIAARNAAVGGLAAAKAQPGDAAAMQQLAGAENQVTQTLGRLFALSESYPDLKANQNMMQLSEELSSTENKVAFARQAYNDAVMGYNNRREVFPNSVVANMFAFQPAQLLEIEAPQKREAVKVSFT
jgi:LemA protein